MRVSLPKVGILTFYQLRGHDLTRRLKKIDLLVEGEYSTLPTFESREMLSKCLLERTLKRLLHERFATGTRTA